MAFLSRRLTIRSLRLLLLLLILGAGVASAWQARDDGGVIAAERADVEATFVPEVPVKEAAPPKDRGYRGPPPPEGGTLPYIWFDPSTDTLHYPELYGTVHMCSTNGFSGETVYQSRATVNPDAFGSCASGYSAKAWFVYWHQLDNNLLLEGPNDVSATFCDATFNCPFETATYTYEYPIDSSVTVKAIEPSSTIRQGDSIVVSFLVTNNGPTALVYDSLQRTCTTGLVNCTVLDANASVGTFGGLDTVRVRVKGNAIGANFVNLRICRLDGIVMRCGHRGVAQVAVLPALPVAAAVRVTPNLVTTNKGGSATFSLTYRVKNTGGASTTFAMQPHCPASIVASGCTASPSSATIAPGDSTTVTVGTMTATNPGSLVTAAVSLTASAAAAEVTGQTAVTVGPNGGTGLAPGVSVTSYSLNPQGSTSRNQCLMLAAGDNAGVECGALRVTHPLPSVRTMDADRAPSLMYLSKHGRPLELIAANVTVLGGTPSTITTTLSIPGESPLVRTHRWPAECANQTCRITVPVNANTLGLGTGWHTYQLEVSATISGTPYTSVDSGGLAIVNRYSSRFGRGWWVSGVEQLVSVSGDTTRKLWVGSDGSTRLYKKPTLGSSIYLLVHPVDRPDTLQRVASNDWRRLLPNGAYTKFNNAGQHIATVNTLGRTTSFYWSSSALDSITVPVPSGSSARRTYAFTYKDTNSTKILTSVTSPSRSGAPRVTTIERSGGWRISRITDPGDAVGVAFTLDGTTSVIRSRANRLGDTAYFAYDSLGGVIEAKQVLKSVVDSAITTRMCPVETRGLVHCGWSGDTVGATPLPNAVTRVDGPRGSLIDVMTFHVNRFGGPDSVRGPDGARTRIERNATFPALVARMTDPSGVVSRAWYNARGLVDSMQTIGAVNASDTLRTRVRWNSKWAMPDTVVSPLSASQRSSYDATWPKLLWTQVGPDDSTRVTYHYNASHRLDSVVAPGGRERFTYDATLGNVYTVKNGPALTVTLRDHFGADSMVFAPESLLTERIFRNVIGRVDSTRATSKAVPYGMPNSGLADTSPVLTRAVRNTYDAENNLIQVQREDTSAAFAGTIATTFYTYDGARRLRVKQDAGAIDSFWYDPAGNQTVHRTARGYRIVSGYDAASRRTYRIVPPVEASAAACGICQTLTLPIIPVPYYPLPLPAGGTAHGIFIAGDMETFTYDEAGRMRSARNVSASVMRSYYPGGALKADTAVTFHNGTSTTTAFLFEVDAIGRRKKRTENASTYQRYEYQDSLGVLTLSVDRQSDSMRVLLSHDAAGRQIKRTVVVPGAPKGTPSLNEYRSYDQHGRLLTREDQGAFTTGVVATVSADSFAYDVSGRQVFRRSGSDDPQLTDTARTWYDGFGAVLAHERWRQYGGQSLVTDEYTVDALGNRHQAWLNRWTTSGIGKTSYDYSGERLGEQYGDRLTGVMHAGLPAVQHYDSSATSYDASGNRSVVATVRFHYKYTDQYGNHEYDTSTTAQGGTGTTHHYYDAAERLRVLQRSMNQSYGRATLQEITYDALGRRVTNRTRRDLESCQSWAGQSEPCLRYLEVFTWDGDQLLRETRTAIAPTDTQSFLGTVRYTHVVGIDDPVLLKGPAGGAWLVPHRSGRGQFEHGTFVATKAPVTGYHWPGRWSGVDLGGDARLEAQPATSWYGGLLEGQKDQGGLMYMRNRYYDPASGRFTQRDPIGLNGGINQYGYANGDPINHSDPFGLCPDPKNPACSQKGAVFTASFAAAGGIGAIAVNWQVGVAINSRGSLMLFGQAGPSVGAGLAVGGQIGAQRGSLNDVLAATGEGGGGSVTAALGARPSVTVSGNETDGVTGVAVGARGGVGVFGNLTNGGLATSTVSIPQMISDTKAAISRFVGEGVAAMRCASGLCRQ